MCVPWRGFVIKTSIIANKVVEPEKPDSTKGKLMKLQSILEVCPVKIFQIFRTCVSLHVSVMTVEAEGKARWPYGLFPCRVVQLLEPYLRSPLIRSHLDHTQTGRGQGGLPTQEEILLSLLFLTGAGTGEI